MKRFFKRAGFTMLTTALCSLTLATAPLPFDVGSIGLPPIALTAHAAGTATLDEENGVLTLSGNVVKSEVRAFANDDRVKYVVAQEGTVFPEDCSELFKDFKHVELMNLKNANTSNVKDMNHMFSYCEALLALDFEGFDTSNVTDMSGMVSYCTNLQNLHHIGELNTSKVTNMQYMFTHCDNLMAIDLDGFDTSKVYSMKGMFSWCGDLLYVGLESFDTSNVSDMTYMFIECSSLKSLNLGSFSGSDSNNLTMEMFKNCKELTTIYVSGLWNSDTIFNSSYMFSGCEKLVGGNGTTYNSKKHDCEYARVDTAGKPGYFTYGTPYCTFNPVTGVLTLQGKVNTDFRTDFLKVYSDYSGVKKIVAQEGTALPENCTDLFNGFSKAVEIDLHNADTSGVTSMRRMFEGCSSCKTFDLTGWNTGKVKDMSGMFYQCAALTNNYL